VNDDEADDEEVIDAEIAATTPAFCPECGSPDIRPVKKLALYLALTLAAFGAGVAVEHLEIAFLFSIVMLLAFLLTPAYQCEACGKRID
jgi:DNA-directed RNA polymerase subunit RPC12/RpoP